MAVFEVLEAPQMIERLRVLREVETLKCWIAKQLLYLGYEVESRLGKL